MREVLLSASDPFGIPVTQPLRVRLQGGEGASMFLVEGNRAEGEAGLQAPRGLEYSDGATPAACRNDEPDRAMRRRRSVTDGGGGNYGWRESRIYEKEVIDIAVARRVRWGTYAAAKEGGDACCG